MTVVWNGIMPAITTPLREDGGVDHDFLVRHARWMAEAAKATAIIPLGSLGEGQTLVFEEKQAIIKSLVDGLDGLAPVVPGIGEAATHRAVELARYAQQVGCGGLMVLPPYVHNGGDRELRAHFDAVISATELPCMLYNNPIAYGADMKPEAIAALAADHPNLLAVKESSGDVRRVTALKALLGDRLTLCVGLDDIVVEGVRAGATGWVAGLVNALPEESARLFNLAKAGETKACDELYAWFLPLLRLDVVPEFVQLIKLVQQEVDMGNERVRLPRLALAGAERERAMELVRASLAQRSEVGK